LHSFAKIGEFETQYQHRENVGRNINSASKARLCKRVDKDHHFSKYQIMANMFAGKRFFS